MNITQTSATSRIHRLKIKIKSLAKEILKNNEDNIYSVLLLYFMLFFSIFNNI
jgi:hypothetical protein